MHDFMTQDAPTFATWTAAVIIAEARARRLGRRQRVSILPHGDPRSRWGVYHYVVTDA